MNDKKKTSFYVATNGRDDWSGRSPQPNGQGSDGPFATLSGARDAVRAFKANGLHQPIDVVVRGGKYFFEETFVLSEADSGSQQCPITYTAYDGEQPILSGGRRLTQWRPHEGQILQCPVADAEGGRWRFRQLFLNGARQIRARYPNFDPENPIYGGWTFAEGPAVEGSTKALRFRPQAFPRRWQKPWHGEIYIVVGKYGSYTLAIHSVDWDDRVITVTQEPRQFDRSPYFRPIPFAANDRFYVENLLEELDEPGEWCLDTEKGVVYYWPPTELDEACEVVAPVLHTLVSMQWVSWVTLSGFTLTETRTGDNMQRAGYEGYGSQEPMPGKDYCGEAIRMRGTIHCRIENNRLLNVGGNGIYMEDTNERSAVVGNEIAHAGKNGISLVGSQYETYVGKTLLRHPIFCRVEDNHVHHCGVFDNYAAGIIVGVGQGNVIGHNLVEYTPHMAICFGNCGYGRNIFEYNMIRHACLEICDTGAIVGWMEDPAHHARKDVERSGHVIRFNWIAGAPGCRVEEDGRLQSDPHSVQGIYLDNMTSNCFVFGNIISAAGTGIWVNMGKNNVIENNVIVDCRWAIWLQAFHYCFPQMYGFTTGNRFCRNIYWREASGTAVCGLRDVKGEEPIERMLAQMDENILFIADGSERTIEIAGQNESKFLALEDWQEAGFDTHSLTADPQFVNVSAGDYRLQPQSPALKLGFVPIPFDQIGIRASTPSPPGRGPG